MHLSVARAALLFCALAIPAQAQQPKRELRVYFVGNSVTDTVNYNALGELAKSRGHKQILGRHMIPGSPLFLLWEASEKKNGFTEPPFGYSHEALANHQWDAVTLQPFDRMLAHKNEQGVDTEGDLVTIQKYIDLALPKSPEVQFYIYSRWPRITINGKSAKYDKDAYRTDVKGIPVGPGPVDDFTASWERKYTGGWDGTNETRDYFEQVVHEVRRANPAMKKPVKMIPVGDIMNELHQRMKAGEVPGYSSIFQLYKDGIHLNEAGSYLVGCAFFAALYGESPVGLPAEPYKVTDAKLAEIIQQTVWKVVSQHPLTGLAK
ncbi:MAG TPA: hypothetical protein VF614_06545 [Chthoniobacteraceae bacterium]|jgi:hypothetical protein